MHGIDSRWCGHQTAVLSLFFQLYQVITVVGYEFIVAFAPPLEQHGRSVRVFISNYHLSCYMAEYKQL